MVTATDQKCNYHGDITHHITSHKWQCDTEQYHLLWYHPLRAFGGLCHRAKFGYDRCSSFDNMNVLIFGAFDCKTPHAHKIGVVWAIWLPKWGAISTSANPCASPHYLSNQAWKSNERFEL